MESLRSKTSQSKELVEITVRGYGPFNIPKISISEILRKLLIRHNSRCSKLIQKLMTVKQKLLNLEVAGDKFSSGYY